MRIVSRNLTILLNDIVGSTTMIAHRSRQAMMDLLQTFDALMRPVIHHYGGRIVKTIGDAYMTVFESPTDAVLCAIRMQYVLRGYNKARPEADQIHVRIAVNSGEVQIAGDGDVFGEAVNLTARLAGVTEADQIYLTEQVYLIMNRNEVPDTLAVKKFSFKGIVGEVTVYRVVQNDDNAVYARIVAAQLRAPEGGDPARAGGAGMIKAREMGLQIWSRGRWWIVSGAAALLVLGYFLTRPPGGAGEAPAVAAATPSAAATATTTSQQPTPAPKPSAPFRISAAKPVGDEVDTLIRLLSSEDDLEVRDAATRLTRARITEARVMAAAAQKLQAGCTERPGNDVHADAMGWLCNLLGQSEGVEYVPVLEKVAATTVHSKVKRFAITNAEALTRRAARSQPAAAPST